MRLISATGGLAGAGIALVLSCGCNSTASSADGGKPGDGGARGADSGALGGHDAGAQAGSAGMGGKAGGSGADGKAGAGGGGATASSGSGGAQAGGSGSGGSGDASTMMAAAAQIVRTLAYHQVSSMTASPAGSGGPVISGDGSLIAYANAPGSEDAATPNEVYVIKPDGSGLKKVDSYKTNCFCSSAVTISADASTVVSTDASQVRVVGSDASMKGALNFTSNEVWNVALSGNGSTVFILQRRDNGLMGGGTVERGVWAADAGGGNHRQLVSPSAVASLFGTSADQVFPFAGCGKSLEFSSDGTRGILAVELMGMGQMALTIKDGSVTKLTDPTQFVKQVAISSDGGKVAVWTQQPSGEEVAVMNFDGSMRRSITMSPQGSCFAPLTLNADGSQLLAGDTALLFPTAGGDPVSLYMSTAGDGVAVGAPWQSVEALFSMAGDAKRFAYFNYDKDNVKQIALLEIDPKDLGAAPAIASPALSSATIPRDRSLGSSVSCKISGDTLDHAGTAVLLHGVEDTAGSWVSGQHLLKDDGMGGDKKAGDGVFTADPITCGDGGDVGPRVVRIKAEAKAPDGRRHATALDVSGLEVK